jgi:hypothetical protein
LTQLTRGAALIAVVFLQNGEDEPLLEFAHCLRVQNIAFVHLQDECFELISHGLPLSLEKLLLKKLPAALFSVCQNSVSDAAAASLLVLLLTAQQIESLIKAGPQF